MIYQNSKPYVRSLRFQKNELNNIVKMISKSNNKSKNNYSNNFSIK